MLQGPPTACSVRRHAWWFRAAVLVVTLAARAVPALADDACPAAIVHVDRYSGAGPFPVTSMVYDSSFAPLATARITFDRLAGTMFLSASSGGRMVSTVRVIERFDVTGVAPGTPVGATLEFALSGWAWQNCGGSGCGVRLQGTLVAGSDSVTANANIQGPGNGTVPLAATVSLPLQFVAGAPVEAQFFLDFGTGPGQNGASVEANGVYSFAGLPDGVKVVACPEWQPTPTRRTSWGSVRLHYR